MRVEKSDSFEYGMQEILVEGGKEIYLGKVPARGIQGSEVLLRHLGAVLFLSLQVGATRLGGHELRGEMVPARGPCFQLAAQLGLRGKLRGPGHCAGASGRALISSAEGAHRFQRILQLLAFQPAGNEKKKDDEK